MQYIVCVTMYAIYSYKLKSDMQVPLTIHTLSAGCLCYVADPMYTMKNAVLTILANYDTLFVDNNGKNTNLASVFCI